MLKPESVFEGTQDLAMGRTPRQQDSAKKRLDIRDVARHANVSIATVSRTMNGAPTVDKELAERVWKSIGALNYFPNTQARALVSGRSRLFGILVSEITNPFFPELIQSFEDVAVRNSYDIMISSTNYDPARMQLCIRRLLERGVEGVAVMTFGIRLPLLEHLTARHVPLVFMDEAPDQPRVSAIQVDYESGIREGVRHFAALGHRGVAFIAGPLTQRSSEARKIAFLAAVTECGMPAEDCPVSLGDHTLEGGMRVAEGLLAARTLPTAILCSNDMTAVGVMRAFSRRQPPVRVPDDVSVMGFDDIQLAEFVYPPLTSIHMSRAEIARLAFARLQAEAERSVGTRAQASARVKTSLTVRQSTAPPRAPGGEWPWPTTPPAVTADAQRS
jgi:DNA-binding LacI/PurR family transcriptional regulator